MSRLRYVEDTGGSWPYQAHLSDGGYYATNRKGEGLFIINRPPGQVNQHLGTGQFRARSLQEFKRRLQRYRARLPLGERPGEWYPADSQKALE